MFKILYVLKCTANTVPFLNVMSTFVIEFHCCFEKRNFLNIRFNVNKTS